MPTYETKINGEYRPIKVSETALPYAEGLLESKLKVNPDTLYWAEVERAEPAYNPDAHFWNDGE